MYRADVKWFAALSSQIEEKVRRKKTYEVYGKETRGKKCVYFIYMFICACEREWRKKRS